MVECKPLVHGPPALGTEGTRVCNKYEAYTARRAKAVNMCQRGEGAKVGTTYVLGWAVHTSPF